MKMMIGTYRYWYNQAVNYLLNLPRGFYIPQDAPEVIELEDGKKKRRMKSKNTVQKKPKKSENVKKPKKPKKEDKANFICYEGQFLRVESGGEYAYGIIPKYDENNKRVSQTNLIAIRGYLKSQPLPEWFVNEKIPVHIIDQACKEAAENYSKICEARKKDQKPFRMNYKSKSKEVVETITMEASSIGKTHKIYSQKYKGIDSGIYTKEPFNFEKNTEYKISYDRSTHKFYIINLVSVNPKITENDTRKEICSIDPGEVVPFAVFDPQGSNVLLVGENHREKFERNTISSLQSKMDKCKIKQLKEKFRSALQRTRDRIQNKQSELHHKLANYLCSNFKHIIIPRYRTSNMKLGKKTNLGIRNIAFFKFLQFLKHKCFETNTKIYVVDEYLTTKTCCCCGSKNTPDKKDSRKYVCADCGIEIHRDANGAVNIYWKHTNLV